MQEENNHTSNEDKNMNDSNTENTGMEHSSLEDTSPVAVMPKSRPKSRLWMWIVGGVLVFIIIVVVGGFLGYQAGIQEAEDAKAAQLGAILDEQFKLGTEDLAAQRYGIARQRFEYIIQQNPAYPGATDKLAELMLAMSITSTPVPTATPVVTPTPDITIGDDAFNQARQLYASQDWTGTINALDVIRKKNFTYRVVDIDGMYYMCYRNRGWNKIINEGNLEGGLYDFSMAEKYGILDNEANGLRTWVKLYITGASYWDLDWATVVSYFSQVYTALPNLRDINNVTATERFRLASIKYGDQLMAADNPCGAYEQYYAVLALSQDSDLKSKSKDAYAACSPPTAVPTKAPEEVPTEPTVTP
jgi:hypothetical protein